MKDRIKLIRKERKLTQESFGKLIGVKGNTITNYENGLRNPSDAIINSICREFNVNEEWLRTGKGEKYSTPEDEVADAVADLLFKSDPFYDMILDLLKRYKSLDAQSKEGMRAFIKSVYDGRNG